MFLAKVYKETAYLYNKKWYTKYRVHWDLKGNHRISLDILQILKCIAFLFDLLIIAPLCLVSCAIYLAIVRFINNNFALGFWVVYFLLFPMFCKCWKYLNNGIVGWCYVYIPLYFLNMVLIVISICFAIKEVYQGERNLHPQLPSLSKKHPQLLLSQHLKDTRGMLGLTVCWVDWKHIHLASIA